MKKFNIVRVLKDKNFRAGLSETQQAAISNPVGIAEISNNMLLDYVAGGATTIGYTNRSQAPTWCCACQN
jgi:hypothetical protein